MANPDNGSIIEIAGINFKYICHEKFDLSESIIGTPPYDPLIKVENTLEENKYIVTVGSYIPYSLDVVTMPSSSLEIIENYIYIKYNGNTNVNTLIPTTNPNGKVICRDFNIVYESKPDSTKFCFYLITFEYTFVFQNALQVEAVIIRDENLDPETSRGTVSTPSNPSV
ncbi:hypothetical protein [Flavivirga jejuensis]|uniref:Uncharacterized protein n=1 Tax=Flavivirga jejuensis TaxID=870487 RepID=A0ABT8WP35_9FLAO|nr:hypothetical protein [Flavivirga jejuensis]MDO5974910.1 hypothetical protein [Flavivirga jejuensis]